MTTNVIGASLSGGQDLVEDVEVGEQRPDEGTVRRLDHDERHIRQLPLPPFADSRSLAGIVGDEDAANVRSDRAAHVDRLDDRPIDARHRDDDALLAVRLGIGMSSRTASLRSARSAVLPRDEQHHRDEDRDQDEHDPRPEEELGGRDLDGDDPRGERHRSPLMAAPFAPRRLRRAEPSPVAHHARTG